MFKLEPITTTNLISLVQVVVVILGFYFSWKSLSAAVASLSLSTKNAQAQMFNQMVLQGRDLLYKHMELFFPGAGDEERAKKQQMHIGALIGYYASCFELKKVLELPAQVEKLLDAELRELMRQKMVREKWDEVKALHSQAFIEYVERKRGIQ